MGGLQLEAQCFLPTEKRQKTSGLHFGEQDLDEFWGVHATAGKELLAVWGSIFVSEFSMLVWVCVCVKAMTRERATLSELGLI